MTTKRFMLVSVLYFTVALATAAEPSMGPVIEDYGPIYPIDDRDVPLPEDLIYRAVFDVTGQNEKPGTVNQELVSVARFLNMHARNGIALENMQLAVVFHGRAMNSALSNEAHEQRYETGNPSYDLLMQLDEAGVQFYICGQSMRFGRYEKQELAPPVRMTLSAMSTLTQLQMEGYALLP